MQAFDAHAYWNRRLTQYPGLTGVGYRRLGAAYNRWLYRVRSHVVRRLIAMLRLGGRPLRVIDIGSGTGHYVREWLLAGAAEVVASDFSEVALKQLRATFQPIQAIRLDITAATLPARLGQYDVVSAFDVLFHVTNNDAYRRAIANCYALCRPGGYFVFSELLFKKRREAMPHMGARTGDKISEILRQVGFIELERSPMFVLMNYPADGSWAARLAWMALMSPTLLGDWAGDLLGRALFTLERFLVSRCFESSSAQILVCRRPPRMPNDVSRNGDFIATGGA